MPGLISIPLAVAVALQALTPASLRAEDWPQWRGPGRDAVCLETRMMESFPPGGLPVHWRVPVGWGWASPVVAGGRVFLADAKVIRARLTAQGCEEISRTALLTPTFPFGGRKVAWSPPAFANRHIFARSGGELVCASLAASP